MSGALRMVGPGLLLLFAGTAAAQETATVEAAPFALRLLVFLAALALAIGIALAILYRRARRVIEGNQVGLDFQDLGRIEEAIICFRRAFRLDPGNVLTCYNLAWALHRLGRVDEAHRQFMAITTRDPGHAGAFQAAGYILLHDKGEPALALPLLRRAAELAPTRGDIQNTIGLALARTGDVAGAETALKRALTLDENLAAARANLGIVLVSTGREGEAVAFFEQAARLQPTAANLANLGNALGLRERDEEAVQALQGAREREPGNGRIRYWLGSLLQRSGRLDEAVAELRCAVDLDAGYAPAHRNLAVVLQRKGDEEGSRRHWERAVALDPTLAKGLS